MLASAAGATAACLWVWRNWGAPDVTMMCNGMLAGLVAITAPCAFVSAPAAAIIGGIAGVLVVVATRFVEDKLSVDDPVGAVAVHGCNGLWGVLSLGLFANGTYGDGLNGVKGGVRGLFYGDSSQFAAQLVGAAANVVWVGVVTAGAFALIGRMVGNRVHEDDEVIGLDVPEMGIEGYSREMLGLSPAPDEPEVTASLASPRLAR
jgi:Amt family ammonium transporter